MSQALRFWKYQGLGNDFVLVTERVGGELARILCDRKLGIGGDGVLEVVSPEVEVGKVLAEVTVWNSDGSAAQICGNGLRCVTLHLHELGEAPPTMVVGSGAGPRRCRVIEGDGRGRAVVEVEMGQGRLERAGVPVIGEGEMIEEAVEVGGRTLNLTAVGMGNPHAVTFEKVSDQEVRDLGPQLERHALFPEGVNAGFAQMEGMQQMRLTVWERGAGLTGACGSGACAAAVAACVTGRAARGQPIRVRQLGGDLTVTVSEGGAVVMSGPAQRVFEGRVHRELLEPGVGSHHFMR